MWKVLLVSVALAQVVRLPLPPQPPTGGQTPLVATIDFNQMSADIAQLTNGVYWDGPLGKGVAGPNVASWGAWTCGAWPQGDHIVLAAGRSGTPNDRGFRHVVCAGTNQNGGSIKISWPIAREIWIQWWQRYGPALEPSGAPPSWFYEKGLDINDPGPDGRVTVGQNQGSGGWGLYTTFVGGNKFASTGTWVSQQGGSRGSNQWNKYQIHLRAESGPQDGVAEGWINGVRVTAGTGLNLTNGNASFAGWFYAGLGINMNQALANTPTSGMYTDYDDFKISHVGYITQD